MKHINLNGYICFKTTYDKVLGNVGISGKAQFSNSTDMTRLEEGKDHYTKQTIVEWCFFLSDLFNFSHVIPIHIVPKYNIMLLHDCTIEIKY